MTERQTEICVRLCNDETLKEIAYCLGISRRGLNYHIREIKNFYKVRNIWGITAKVESGSTSHLHTT